MSLFCSSPDPRAVRIIPLGGCGEFGMNLTAYLTGGNLYVVDCGVRFPDPARLGVDAVLPDVTPFFGAVGSVTAYFLTHGHEDHLGAMAHVLPRWPAPVYGTAWTMQLMRNKLTKLGLKPELFQLLTVRAGEKVGDHKFSAEFVHVNHSIPQTCGLFLRTPQLRIFHTGDFKIDMQPVIEAPADLERLAAIGNEGVDVMLADSTNAEKAGRCPGEREVLGPMTEVFRAARSGVIVTTFSSNLWRLKTVADACVAAGRKLYIAGNGLETTLACALSTGLYELPAGLRLSDDQLAVIARDKLVVLATGCQGEWRSAMARIASGEHRQVRIEEGDTVVMSARIIPGNEKAILGLTNNFLRAGARVITGRDNPGLHVSGHAYGGDLDQLVTLLKPKRYLPVHGAFSQLRANLMRLASAGTGGQAHLIETGDVFDITREALTEVGKVEVPLAFVDEGHAALLSLETLRERLRVGELGAALVTGVFELATGSWLVPVAIDLTGLTLPPAEAQGWLDRVASGLQATASQMALQKGVHPSEVNEEVRVTLRRQLFHLLKKKPVVTTKLHII